MNPILMRLLGIILLMGAVCLVIFWRTAVRWLGRPLGWALFWESYQGKPGLGGVIYALCRTYIIVAGWFYLLLFLLLLSWIGYHLVLTGKW